MSTTGSTSKAADPTPATPSTSVSVPTDTFASVKGKGVSMILASEYILDSSKLDDAGTVLIYSDIIYVTGDQHFIQADGSGKNVGLFCNQMQLSGTTTAKLSTSGKKGDDLSPDSAASPNPGKDAGWMKICVEDADETLLPRTTSGGSLTGLLLEAEGGTGGMGSDKTTTQANGSASDGGPGGGGGKGGAIEIYYGSPELQRMVAFTAAQTWTDKAGIAMKQATQNGIPDPTNLASLQKVAKLYADFSDALVSLGTNIGKLTRYLDNFEDQDGVSDLAKSISALSDAMKPISQLTMPQVSTTLQQSLADTNTTIESVLKNHFPDSTTWTTLKSKADGSTSLLQQVKEDPQTEFGGDWEAVVEDFEGSILLLNGDWTKRCSTNGGTGGQGGKGSSGDAKWGSGGAAGLDGNVNTYTLDFRGRDSILDFPSVLAQPDHCQMLSNRADLKYLTATSGAAVDINALEEAQGLYLMLKRRLSFADTALPNELQKNPTPKDGSTSTRALLKAYIQMEAVYQLTISPIAQITAINNHATRCLKQIDQHQDLFGQLAEWTPRLSFSFYQSSAKSYLATFKDFETTFESATSLATDVNNKALQSAQSNFDSAETRIQILTGSNGALEISAYQIAAFTPTMKAKQDKVHTAIEKISDSIQNKLNLDPTTIVDAFSSLAMAPSKFNAVVQLAGVGYSAATTVESSAGVAVNKDYVVSQFGSCNSDLGTLVENYKSTTSLGYELDDPGAAKLLIAQTDFETLVGKFQNAIPTDQVNDAKTAFTDYVTEVQKRNDAVMSYNTTLQLLAEAQSDRDFYASQKAVWGGVAMNADPNLPARIFWIRKCLNDLRYTTFEILSYGERALRYWGLPLDTDISNPMDSSSVAPTADLLSTYSTAMDATFTACLTNYASNLSSMWPSENNRNSTQYGATGLTYTLSSAELSALKTKSVMADGSYVHEVDITIPPVISTTDEKSSDFHGRANVRIDQVRVWLPGALVTANNGKTWLTVEILQLGRESIVRGSDSKVFTFVHDPVTLGFTYNCGDVKTEADIPHANIFDQQLIPSFRGSAKEITDSSIAPIGPFAEWRIKLSSTQNTGLDLSGLVEAQMEFWGCNDNFT